MRRTLMREHSVLHVHLYDMEIEGEFSFKESHVTSARRECTVVDASTRGNFFQMLVIIVMSIDILSVNIAIYSTGCCA